MKDKKKYFKEIQKMCIDAGTYAPYFDKIIMELAEIMVLKDDAERQYIENGGETVVTHVNKAKEANLAKNPALTIIMDLKTLALAYWRDLGLTPKGLKSLGETIKKEESTSLEGFLSNLGI